MNTIEGALFEYLQTQSTVADYVGGVGASVSPPPTARIYPVRVRQGPPIAAQIKILPALSYEIIGGDSEIAIDASIIGRGYKRIQINAWSQDVKQAKAIIEAVRLLTAGKKMLWDDVQVAVVEFRYGPDGYD